MHCQGHKMENNPMAIKQKYTGTWIPAYVMLNEKIKPIDKLVYAEIASFRQCFMTNETLANLTGVSVRTIQYSLKRLEEINCIRVILDGNYRVCVSTLQQIPTPYHAKSAPPHAKSAYINNNINKEKNKQKENRELLNQIIAIINPLEKPTDSRLHVLNGRLKEGYTATEILAAAKELSKSEWHRDNKQMSVDNLLAPSKFGRWYQAAKDNTPKKDIIF